LDLKPIEIKATFINRELFTGGGTLISYEHQILLKEFYGKEDQR
jgi:hypothetical protein